MPNLATNKTTLIVISWGNKQIIRDKYVIRYNLLLIICHLLSQDTSQVPHPSKEIHLMLKIQKEAPDDDRQSLSHQSR